MIKRTISLFLYLAVTSILFAGDNYTVILSLDGFRHDYTSFYNTPNLDSMEKDGVSAIMSPSFPASTFPNHYTLATGLVPDHHGIINNVFWVEEKGKNFQMGDPEMRNDPSYYGGEPIWTTAQKQGLKTGNLYWVGSDIPIKNSHPTFYKVYADTPRLSYEQRIDTIVSWLNRPADSRPQLIMAYIEQPDGAGHKYGPESKEVGDIVSGLDSLVGDLIMKIRKLPIADKVNIIVTSDHGMAEIDNENKFINASEILKPEWYERMCGTTPTAIFTKPGYKDSVMIAVNNCKGAKAYYKENLPEHLNYGRNPRMGDIVVVPECGWHFDLKPKGVKGAHGFDPANDEMKVIFRAVGPDFKKGYKSDPFINTDIYVLLAKLLGIKPEDTDGDYNRIKGMLF